MSWHTNWRRAEPADDALPEVWTLVARDNRHWRRLSIAMTLLAFVALADAAHTRVTALSHPLVYYVDTDGRAVFGGALQSASVPADVEVRYVAKRFIRLTVGINSLTVERDFADAWNLMTEELQAQHDAELAQYEKQRGYSFVQFVKRSAIRTELDIARLDVARADGAWTVRAFGHARTWPLNAAGQQASFREQDWEVSLTLVELPRTELTPNGLLVSQRTLHLFDPVDPAQAQEATVPGAAPSPSP